MTKIDLKKSEGVSHPFIAKPMRRKSLKRPSALDNLFSSLASSDPGLIKKLKLARMDPDTGKFIKQVLTQSLLFSITLTLALGLIFFNFKVNFLFLIPVFMILTIFFYFFWKMLPTVKMNQRSKKIDQEIVFAGRHLVIALRAGIPLFDAMVGVTRDYGEVSREFSSIVDKITLGEPSTKALRATLQNCPSKFMQRVFLQIINSINSGSNVADALETTLDQISKEQIIQLKEYGQKLNPLSMFYMMIGIIFPSLGVTFMIVMLSFAGDAISSLGVLLLVLVGIVLTGVQFSFLSIIESSRPNFELS